MSLERIKEIHQAAYGFPFNEYTPNRVLLVNDTVIDIVSGVDGAVYIYDEEGEIVNVVTDELEDSPEFMPAIAYFVATVCMVGGEELRNILNKGVQ